MRKTFLAVIPVLAICVAPGASQAPPAAGRERPAVSPTWEYRVLTNSQLRELGKKDLTVGLNAVGSEGWELIAVEPASVALPSDLPRFYFKRPVAARRPAPPAPPQTTINLYQLKHAQATEMVRILQSLLADRDRMGLRVTADERTNTLLVNAASDDQLVIEAVLHRLDMPVEKKAGDGASKP